MPLGTEVGLGPGRIVLDGNPAPPPSKKVAKPDQDVTWYGNKPTPTSIVAKRLDESR